MRRRLALLLIAAFITACTSNAHSSTPPRTPKIPVGPIDWVACKGNAGPSGFQCATIAVPRDPLKPSLGTIEMAIDRRPASGHKIGSLLVNPGGPGASGVDFLPQAVSLMPASLLARFDVIGFDPPGVSRTAPILCLDPAGLTKYFDTDPDPPTQAGITAMIAEDRVFASGCASQSGAELPYVSTVDAAMDMDVIRGDVGDPKLNYFGFSYGTFLGATYADLYPTRIRAMVLDGAIDPSVDVIASLDQQSASIEQELDQVFASCASNRNCAWKPGGNLLGAYESLMQRVRANPVAVPGSSQRVGPAELLYGTVLTLYSPAAWGDLESALAELSRGDGSEMLQLFNAYVGRQSNGTYSNELEANTAINCLDSPSPSISAIEKDAPAAAAAAPVFGVADLYSEIGCAVWPVPATGHPHAIHAPGSPPILVIGSTGDPATPYSEAVSLAHQLDHGVLLTRVGEGHTGYEFSACVRAATDLYLTDLAVPAAGTRCPSS
jgi:pimeloyl-ACP methyl ester carboxylesterase